MKAPAPLKVATIVKSKVILETVKDGCQINRLKGIVCVLIYYRIAGNIDDL